MAFVAGLSLVLVPLLLPALFACTVSETFDPTGGDVAVSARWTLNGSAVSVESCEAACIDTVRLEIWERFEGGKNYTQDEWVVDCAAGSITTQPILKADTYRIGVYGVSPEPDGGGTCDDDGSVQAAAIVEASAEAGGTLDVSLNLSPEPSE